MSFYQNLLRICKENNTSPSAVAKEIGYSNAAAAYWKRGATPKLRTLRALGDYFNISWLEFIDPEERGKWLNLMPAVAEDKQGNWRKWASSNSVEAEKEKPPLSGEPLPQITQDLIEDIKKLSLEDQRAMWAVVQAIISKRGEDQ